MNVKELKSLLENVPDETKVIVWGNAAGCCHRVESAFYLFSGDKEEIQYQFGLIEKTVDLSGYSRARICACAFR